MAKRKNIRGRISLADAAFLAPRMIHVQGRLNHGAILIAGLFYAAPGGGVNSAVAR
jgi:hypothetical protein